MSTERACVVPLVLGLFLLFALEESGKGGVVVRGRCVVDTITFVVLFVSLVKNTGYEVGTMMRSSMASLAHEEGGLPGSLKGRWRCRIFFAFLSRRDV